MNWATPVGTPWAYYGATTHTYTLPADARRGDVMVWGFVNYYTDACTGPAKLIEVRNDTASGGRIYVGWRILTGGEPASFSLTGANGSYSISCGGIFRPEKPVRTAFANWTDSSAIIPATFVPNDSVVFGFYLVGNANRPYPWYVSVDAYSGSAGNQRAVFGRWPVIGGTCGPAGVGSGGGGSGSTALALVFPPAASGPDSTMR